MIADDLYAELIRRGVKFSIQGELLTFTAPKEALSRDLIALMKRHKAALIACVKLANSTTDAEPKPAKSYFAGAGQEALWLIHQSNPENPAYHTAAAIQLLSAVDESALNRALRKLVLRHDVLRTTFDQHDLQLVAHVHELSNPDFAVIDASSMSASQLQDAIRKEYLVPYNLTTGPLFRTRLFSQASERHVVLLLVHHIIFDATSLWILQNDLQALYAAEVSGDPALLPGLSASYEDFSNWQRNFIGSEEGEKQWKHWKDVLRGDPAPAELVWSQPRPRSGERDCATFKRKLDDSLKVGLRQLSKQLNATPFATGLAAFQTLVYRYTGQLDFVLGTTTHGRTQQQFARGIGYFVNVLPIRSRITSGVSFSKLVDETKSELLGALQASDFPFPLIVKRLNPVRSSNAAPLCRMVFGLQKPHGSNEVSQLLNDTNETVAWGGLKAQAYEVDQQEGQFDLTLELYESTSSFSCVIKYDRNLLSDSAVERLAEHFVNLLTQVIEDPNQDLDSYGLITQVELKEIFNWSGCSEHQVSTHAGATDNQEKNVSSLRYDSIWAASVAAYPQSTALIFQERSWTYEELDRWANGVANRFVAEGVKPGDRILVKMRRHPLAPVCLLAALKCGAAYVPIAPDSPDYRLKTILSECQPKVIVGDFVGDTSTLGLLEADAPNWKPIEFSPETAAYVLYTSGSTGIPKGVEVSQHAIAEHANTMATLYGMSCSDRVLQFCDLTFDPSLEQFLTPWSVGGSVVMRPDSMYTGDGFWRAVVENGVTVANLPPSFFNECSEFIPASTDLRLMIVGGDVFPSQALSKWKSFGGRLLNAYGPTEAVITSTTKEVLTSDPSRKISIGHPKPGSIAVILNPKGHLNPIGIPGELVLGGPMLASGYIGDANLTNQRFQMLTLGQSPPARFYRTGDLARWNDAGEIEFLGRMDRQIKIRGFRIEPGEVETALRGFSSVKDAIVRVCEDQDRSYLAGYLLTEGGIAPDREKLLLHLKSRLPAYMIPERFAALSSWPLNDAGKIVVDRLPSIKTSKDGSSRKFVEPRNALEQVLVGVWQEVLEVDEVGVQDDFYELGGGSLQSLRIISRLREKGVKLKDSDSEMSPHLLFQYVTIAELSTLLHLSATPEDPVASRT